MIKGNPTNRPTIRAIVIAEMIIGFIASGLSFVLFLEIAQDVLGKELLHIDVALSQYVYSFRTPELTKTMKFVSFLGEGFIWMGFIGLLMYFIWRNYKREAWLLSWTVLMGYALNHFIKFVLKVPRPTIDPIYVVKFYSFPSGHSMNSFIFYASLVYFFHLFTRNKILSALLTCGVVVLVCLIGLSRVYLGVHYPSDVIAGGIAGFCWFVTVMLIDKTIVYFRVFHEKR